MPTYEERQKEDHDYQVSILSKDLRNDLEYAEVDLAAGKLTYLGSFCDNLAEIIITLQERIRKLEAKESDDV